MMMKRYLIFLLIMVLACVAVSAAPVQGSMMQDEEENVDVKTYSARVCASDTDEPLAYATVFVRSGVGTMTNEDGEFTIKASPEDVIRISYMGFSTISVQAKDLKRKMKMKPMENSLAEVTVVSGLSILREVEKKLKKDFSKGRKNQSQFFMRQVTSTSQKELVEAFFEAKNSVNLRDINMLKGRHGRRVANNLMQTPLIADMNFHHPLELGPMMKDSRFWQSLVYPFRTVSTRGSRQYGQSLLESKNFSFFYDNSCEVLIDDNNNKFYKITVTKKQGKSGLQIVQKGSGLSFGYFNDRRACLEGTLLIDAKDYQLLSFDGVVKNLTLDVTKDFVKMRTPIDLSVKINYRTVKGYTEVENIIYSMSAKGLSNKAMLINIDRLGVDKKGRVVVENVFAKKKEKTKVAENLLASITSEGFDEIMAENADFVKRTHEESDLADGKVLSVNEMLTTEYKVANGKSVKQWKLALPDTKLGNLVNRLVKMGQVIPQEKVYVQMDNTCYFLGDTIWFSAFLRRTSDDRPSGISGILYVELLNQDGYVMQRQMVDMKNGRGYGNFATNPDWYGGYYELRAYTRWQLNWGVYEREHSKESEYWFINKEMEHRYFRDYDKLYSRVFPMYDAPKNKGEYNQIMSPRQLRHYFKNNPDKRELEVNLYPEGGELIAGVPNRIAFEAVYTDGEYADGVLTEKVSRKESKELARTVNRGRGVFTYTPADDSNVEFVFKSSFNGEETKVKFKDVQKDGVVLYVSRNDSVWDICVRKVGILQADTLGLTVMHDGRVRRYVELCSPDTLVSIPDYELEAGVNQVTVFNAAGGTVADRLFFVSRQNLTKDNIIFTGLKDQYSPYEKIQIGVEKAAEANVDWGDEDVVSVSIRDMEFADNLHDNGTMQTEMLLSSELKGFIPNPGWFFEKDDDEHRKALDLLMMTQGWRRFNWRDMAVRGAWDLTQPDERTPIVVGNIYKYPPHYFYNTDEYDHDYLDPDEENSNGDLSPEGLASSVNNSTTKLDQSGKPVSENDKLDLNIDGGELRGSAARDAFTDYSKSDEDTGSRTAVKPSVIVHAELTKVGVDDDFATGEVDNKKGKFRMALPKFHDRAVFFLSAADTAKLKKGKEYQWVQGMPNRRKQKLSSQIAYPKFSLRVDFPYPRYVKPYDFYQERTNLSDDNSFGEKRLSDGSYQLAEVKVRAKHSGVREFNDSVPALIVDGYEAYNFALDAGMRHATPADIARAYVGDYGSPQPYRIDPETKQKVYRLSYRFGAGTLDRMFTGNTMDEDSMYLRKNLESHEFFHNTTGEVRLENIDKYVLYTDYQPRMIGSKQYQGPNLPTTINVVYPYLDDTERHFYRERRYIMDGLAIPDEFYSPDYSNRQLPEVPADYRRTLYWNPQLKLDSKGATTISFWNNSNQNQISVKAEGMTSQGAVLKGEK